MRGGRMCICVNILHPGCLSSLVNRLAIWSQPNYSNCLNSHGRRVKHENGKKSAWSLKTNIEGGKKAKMETAWDVIDLKGEEKVTDDGWYKRKEEWQEVRSILVTMRISAQTNRAQAFPWVGVGVGWRNVCCNNIKIMSIKQIGH